MSIKITSTAGTTMTDLPCSFTFTVESNYPIEDPGCRWGDREPVSPPEVAKGTILSRTSGQYSNGMYWAQYEISLCGLGMALPPLHELQVTVRNTNGEVLSVGSPLRVNNQGCSQCPKTV